MITVSSDGRSFVFEPRKPLALTEAAAQNHIQKFYRALQSDQSKIASFYAPADENETKLPGLAFISIVFNGNEFLDPQDFQTIITETMSPIQYEIHAFDCQTIIPSVNPKCDIIPNASKGTAMTLLILVSGGVRIGPLKESEMKGFSESFVLVPNPLFSNLRKKGKHTMEWLIQSQTFRYTS